MADATAAEVVDMSKKGKRPEGAKKPPPGEAQLVNPLWAQSARLAAGLGRSAGKPAFNAMGLECQKIDPPKRKRKRRKRTRKPWGMHTWNKRWHLERKRSRYIAMLTPGMMLAREYKGVIHRVLVRERDYLHVTGDRVYPTLAAVTTAITGKTRCQNGRWLAPISTVRFWNLNRLLVVCPM